MCRTANVYTYFMFSAILQLSRSACTSGFVIESTMNWNCGDCVFYSDIERYLLSTHSKITERFSIMRQTGPVRNKYLRFSLLSQDWIHSENCWHRMFSNFRVYRVQTNCNDSLPLNCLELIDFERSLNEPTISIYSSNRCPECKSNNVYPDMCFTSYLFGDIASSSLSCLTPQISIGKLSLELIISHFSS